MQTANYLNYRQINIKICSNLKSRYYVFSLMIIEKIDFYSSHKHAREIDSDWQF